MKWIATTFAVMIGASQALAAPAILVDADNGDVLFAQEATRSWHPASLTKLMTAHVALLGVQSGAVRMDSMVVISANAAAAPPSKSGIAAGLAIRLDEAMRIMLVRSANDIAVAIAETVKGNVPDFVAAMNDEAARLGMSATRFRNPNGLDDDEQVTNARDMAVLALAISRRHAGYADLFRVPFVTLNGTTLPNTNDLLGKYRGIDGMKTGYTCSAGWNLTASASQDGRRYISVVLGAKSKADRTTLSSGLLDLGFSGKATKVGNVRSMKAQGVTEASDAEVCGRAPKAVAAPKPRQASPQRPPAATQARSSPPALSTSAPLVARRF
jgi:D-alanyl-D-alanine carboxypeptidase